MKETAALRSLADQVASPVVAGRKSRKGLSVKQRSQWSQITDSVVAFTHGGMAILTPKALAESWERQCKFAGIGTGIFGWFLWNWAFPLLLELAKLWIESRNQGRVSDR